MSDPLISVVLPTYNGERYLGESIQSVLGQSLQDWELLIVDDCSTDSTPEIIRTYLRTDDRITCIRNPVNRKLPASLNIGFVAGRGRYFTWTSDDNLYKPEALEQMAGFLDSNPGIGLVYADHEFIDQDGVVTDVRRVEDAENLCMWNVVGACFLYRSEIHRELGGYAEDLFCIEDYEFWLRVAARHKIAPLHQVLYSYRSHPQSLTSTQGEKVERLKLSAIERNLQSICWPSADAKALVHERLAFHKSQDGMEDEAFRYLKECFPASGARLKLAGWAYLRGDARRARRHTLMALPEALRSNRRLVALLLVGERGVGGLLSLRSRMAGRGRR